MSELVRFSDEYIKYYQKAEHCRVNVLEGAYRAGKTVLNIFSFAHHLETCEDKLHLVTGATSGTARINVLDNNGFGLEMIFGSRCRMGKFESSDALFIKDLMGRQKIVLFIGGGDSGSYKKIQGLSFGSWLSVELANLYISDDEKCFIDMALSRLTQSSDQKIWWDLNPVYPSHKVYTKYLDVYEKKQAEGNFAGGYNYLKCTLFDNTALSEEQRNNYLSQFLDTNSMEYRRYVLGDRAVATGLIFGAVAENPSNYTVPSLPDDTIFKRSIFSIGIDFGGNGSNTTFVATLIDLSKGSVLICKSSMLDMSGGNKGVAEYDSALSKFLKELVIFKAVNRIALQVGYCFCDSADPVMITETRQLVNQLRLSGVTPTVMKCSKATIKDRIKAKQLLLAKGHYKFLADAKTALNSTKTQVWSDKPGHEDERLDDGTADIDTADAEEYSWSHWLKALLARQKE